MNVHAVHFKGIRSLVRITNRCFFVYRADNRFPPIRYVCRFCSCAQRGPKITWRASLFPTEKEKRNASAREHCSTSHIKRWRIRAHCVCHQTCLKENKFDYFFYESNLFILSSSHTTLIAWVGVGVGVYAWEGGGGKELGDFCCVMINLPDLPIGLCNILMNSLSSLVCLDSLYTLLAPNVPPSQFPLKNPKIPLRK